MFCRSLAWRILSTTFVWRRKWQPTPVFLPGKSHGWKSLVGYSSWGHKESDMTERLHFHFHFHWLIEKAREFQKTSTSALFSMLKPLTLDHNKLWKILQEMGITEYLTCLLRNLYTGQEAGQETGQEQQTGSKLGKEYIKAVYCHPAYLTSMQSTSCEMPGWMKHKLESRLPGETSITSDMQMTPPLWQKVKKN